MPITVERMQLVIDLASETLEKSETAKRIFKSILRDAEELRTRLNEKQIEDGLVDDLVYSITILARNAVEIVSVDASVAQELGAERARFMINQGKNKSARERMQAMRKREKVGIKEEGEKERALTREEISERLNKINVKGKFTHGLEEYHIESTTETETIDKNWLPKTGEKE